MDNNAKHTQAAREAAKEFIKAYEPGQLVEILEVIRQELQWHLDRMIERAEDSVKEQSELIKILNKHLESV